MADFNPSSVGLGELLASAGMQDGMRQLAGKARDRAEQTSPVGPDSDPHRGEYRSGWRVESGVRNEPTRRAYAEIVNDAEYAASVEFGNGRGQQGQYVLTRALDAMRE